MKTIPLIAFTAFATIFIGCNSSESHHDGDVHNEDIEHDEHDDDHNSDFFHFEAEQADALGVKTTIMDATPFNEAIEVAGEIILSQNASATVTAPTSGIINFNPTVSAGVSVTKGNRIASITGENMIGGDINVANSNALQAAKAELDRLAPLRELGIVTAQQYAAAELAYRQALNAAGGNHNNAGMSATAPISGVISTVLAQNGQYVDAGSSIATIVNSDGFRLRAEVPTQYLSEIGSSPKAYYVQGSNPTPVRAGQNAPIERAATTNGYTPVFFSIDNADVTPGYAKVFIETSETSALSVPSDAIIERLGNYFIYIKISDDHYQRRNVTIGRKGADRIEILSGIQPGECYVSEGAAFVRMAETATVVPEGHHHH